MDINNDILSPKTSGLDLNKGPTCLNSSGEVIPPLSACKIDSVDDDGIITVVKPDEDSIYEIMISPYHAVPSNSYFEGISPYDEFATIKEDDIASLAVGDELGTEEDQWTLTTSSNGYVCLGGSGGAARIRPFRRRGRFVDSNRANLFSSNGFRYIFTDVNPPSFNMAIRRVNRLYSNIYSSNINVGLVSVDEYSGIYYPDLDTVVSPFPDDKKFSWILKEFIFVSGFGTTLVVAINGVFDGNEEGRFYKISNPNDPPSVWNYELMYRSEGEFSFIYGSLENRGRPYIDPSTGNPIYGLIFNTPGYSSTLNIYEFTTGNVKDVILYGAAQTLQFDSAAYGTNSPISKNKHILVDAGYLDIRFTFALDNFGDTFEIPTSMPDITSSYFVGPSVISSGITILYNETEKSISILKTPYVGSYRDMVEVFYESSDFFDELCLRSIVAYDNNTYGFCDKKNRLYYTINNGATWSGPGL